MQTIPPISQLNFLKSAQNVYDLANILNVETQFLTRVLYQWPYRSRYNSFSIPKKSGGVRIINAPDKKLYEIQARLAAVLYECRREISDIETSSIASSYGFERGRAPIDNARKHINRRFVLNFDLLDFFPSIHIGRIKGFLKYDRNFQLHDKMALLISQIACHEGALPQGSPLSPILANMVAQVLDRRIRKFANLHRLTYTRYVDDITLSTNLRTFPDSVAIYKKNAWTIAEPLEKLVEKTGYKINHKKTRMQLSSQRQIVTGLTVNSKPMPCVEYRKNTRAMCHKLFNEGIYKINDRKYDISKSPKDIRPLKGRLSHIAHISQLNKGKGDKLTSLEKLQVDFAYFESFILRDKPLILTEGFTDRLYLKCAMRHLDLLPKELLSKDRKPIFAVFNPTYLKRRYLKIGDGAQQIKGFMFANAKLRKKYKYHPEQEAIIGLLDNDSEGKKVVRDLEKGFDSTWLSDSVLFLGSSLYVILLNHLGEGNEIEQFFSDELLRRKIGNRPFELISSSEDAYTKKDFAKFVVPKYSTNADFIDFKKIFKSISECIAHNKKTTNPNTT